MKVDWHKIPYDGLPKGCPKVCWIQRGDDGHIYLDRHCCGGAFPHTLNHHYADATGHIPDPPEPEPENPPKPETAPGGKEFTGECRVPVNGEAYVSAVHGGALIVMVSNAQDGCSMYGGKRWILRDPPKPDGDTIYMLNVLSKIRDVVDESIEELT